MKKYYWKNLLLSKLTPHTAIDVFTDSIGKLEDSSFINTVISVLRREDIEAFLVLLKKTTYASEEIQLVELIKKYPIGRRVYELLKDVPVLKIDRATRERLRQEREEFILNYCLIREIEEDYKTFEVFEGISLDKVHIKRTEENAEYGRVRYVNILRNMLFNIKEIHNKEIYDKELLNKELLNNTNSLATIHKLNIKEPLLLAILDKNGRVNALEYKIEELSVVNLNQIYNLTDKNKILFMLRHKDRREEIEEEKLIELLEDAILQTDIEAIKTVLLNCEELRVSKYLKVLLKLYIQEFSKQNFTEILEIINLFEMNPENETIAISFLKASESASNEELSYLIGAIKAIPYLMKTRRLHFACFVTLLSAFMQGTKFIKIVVKNFVYRFNIEFMGILDLILEFYNKIKGDPSINIMLSNINDSTLIDNDYTITNNRMTNNIDSTVSMNTSLLDFDFLATHLSIIAEIFSTPPLLFIHRNIYYIFNAFYPSSSFTPQFIHANIKYVVIHRILSLSFRDQVDDVDVLVGLFFNDRFSSLDDLFRPSISFFIKKNLSHILFKIKSTYTQAIYNMKACIYKVIKFILEHVNLTLYFNYVWPYVEFFLNSQPCFCASYFLEWLRSFNNSRLIFPYLTVPFNNIEDIPVIPNLEIKIAEMLARFFSEEKKPFNYYSCPYSQSNNRSNHKKITSEKIDLLGDLNSPISSIYSTIRDCIPNYTPINLPISDLGFVRNFLKFYHSNKFFRNTINALNPSALPLTTKALFGDLRYPTAPNWHSSPFTQPVSDIPRVILLSFLVKINHEKQDLFAFTIQECLKCTKESFDPDVESFIDQFRHTKFEYKFTLKPVFTLDLSTYRSFLESALSILYSKTKQFSFMKYLILFDDSILEFACLCLIKTLLSENYSEWGLFNTVETTNSAILRFLLKINTFVCKTVIERSAYLIYALRANDYYSLIYGLEDGRSCVGGKSSLRDVDTCNGGFNTIHGILQVAYYMIGDLARVKGFNTSESYEYSRLSLFFDFIIGRNYKAARHVSDQISNQDSVHAQSSTTDKHKESTISGQFILRAIKEILDCNESVEVEDVLIKDMDIGLHVLKDLELLMGFMNKRSDKDQKSDHTLENSVIKLIENRRKISKNPELILKIHKHLENKVGCKEFSRSIDLELIKSLIRKREYQKAEEEIARLTLQGEYSVLYEHALIKIEQREYSEAKELLRRMREIFCKGSIEYFKATVKLCELRKSKGVFEDTVRDFEEILLKMDCTLKKECTLKGDYTLKKDGLNMNDSFIECNNPLCINPLCKNPLKKFSTEEHNNSQIHIEAIKYTQKLYFLTAKYFEKHDTLISVKYYFKSFTSNKEAIPRFFHLIADISRTHLKIIAEMVEIIKKEYLSAILPFYNQISTKIALETSTVKIYKDIIFTILERFPYQTHWNTLFLYNSKRIEVSKVMIEIVNALSLERRRLFMDIKECSEKFTTIAKNNNQTLSMENFPEIRDLFPSKVNIPGQITEINNIKNEIVVFRSLQKPKKITLIGEDGKDYAMIVKFKDDLRKDSRFMDLDSLLNSLFKEEFYIRKYNVIPFNHEAGIIEFLPNLLNLKDIVFKYTEGIPQALQRFIKTKMIGVSNFPALESEFPPVFNRHLRTVYSEPFLFYKSRENYIRTYAIMNIVGWFMGLGDRHCENIHFDQLTGDTVHVDLNCIFDRAKTLEIPEKVPFRLTQNIIDGFGVLGIEGTYKDTLKYTIGVLKDNRDVIQANLLSFVFDPLFEWAKKKTEPTKIIECMNEKLDFEDSEFRIEELIREARNVNNLGGMYIGWMSFI